MRKIFSIAIFVEFAALLLLAAPVQCKELKVVILQIDPIAGDFAGNQAKIEKGYLRAEAEGADIVVTPETAVEGYTLGDFFERPDIWDQSGVVVEYLKNLTHGKHAALLVGHIALTPKNRKGQIVGKPIQNVASAFVDGKLDYRQAKSLLPDYDVYRDARWFSPATKNKPWKFRDHVIGVAICEDFWRDDQFSGPSGSQIHYYKRDPVEDMKKAGVEIAISLSASPYGQDKQAYRERIHAADAIKLNAPIIWAGMTGATDHLVFDGRSFILNAKGQTVDRLGMFHNDYAMVTIKDDKISVIKDSKGEDTNPKEIRVVRQAIDHGIKNYMERTGSTKIVIGESGGSDSALVTKLAVEAVGAENVIIVLMPSRFSSEGSITDAIKLADNLGIPGKNRFFVSIDGAHRAFESMFRNANVLDPLIHFSIEHSATGAPVIFVNNAATPLPEGLNAFGNFWLDGALIDENTQARIRMTILHGISNTIRGAIVAGTSNKTEIGMGFLTLGADDKSGLSIIGDIYKSEVYLMLSDINAEALERGESVKIPVGIITKKASPELKEGQISEDTTRPFFAIDPIILGYVEYRMSPKQLDQLYRGNLPNDKSDWVYQVIRTINIAEYKRWQSAPIIRVSRKKTFDRVARQVPIAAIKLIMPMAESLSCIDYLKKNEIPVMEWFPTTLTPTLVSQGEL